MIIGEICGLFLAAGKTGFWKWFFALGGEILNLYTIRNSISKSGIDSDSTSTKVINVIGTIFWIIGLVLLFSGVETFVLGLFCFLCLFISSNLIVASLYALFGNLLSIFLIGIAKVVGSILFYNGSLKSLDNTFRVVTAFFYGSPKVLENESAEFPGKLVAYIAIISLFVLLFWIVIISRKITSSNKERRERKIFEEKQRKISCSNQLILAAGNNDKNAVLNMLEQGADVNYKDSDGKTPLSNAVINGNADIASLLLEKGADIDVFYDGKPILFCAIKSDNKELVELLIEKGVNIEYEDEKEHTPLFYATCNNKIDMVSLLLEKGSSIEYKGKYESTPLFVATCNRSLELVSLLLEKGANVECKNEDGITPLSAAAAKGYIDVASLLLEKGANIECEDKNGTTPLVYAIISEKIEMLHFLIEKGANIEHKDNPGGTPLRHAVSVENKEIISLLLDKGANINCISKIEDSETTPLFSAIGRNKEEEIISLLLEKGADVNVTVMNGFSVLQKAICDKNKKLVTLFLDAGAEINRNSNEIETALFDAVDPRNYEPEIFSLLIERGADVNLESAYNGLTPLVGAVGQDNKNATLLLLKNGADPNKKSSKAGTPLMIAFQAANKDMCSLLMENGANPADVLCASAMMPTTEVAQFFLDRGADVNGKGLGDKTPLMCAILFSTKEMVLFLISRGADVNSEVSEPGEKNAARTPLEAAIVTGNAEMVSLLITYGADVNYITKNGNTPLLFAALHQKTELVPILKEAGAVSHVSSRDAQ